MSNLAYHYTPHGPKILSTGMIRRETGPVLPGEKRAVWLTTATKWEPTCWKKINGKDVRDPAELARLVPGGLLHRIGVSTDLWFIRTIPQWRKESGCPALMQRILIDKTGEEFKISPEQDWRVSFRQIDKKFWKSIEQSDDGINWESLAYSQAA